jgi:Lon protease-like protein
MAGDRGEAAGGAELIPLFPLHTVLFPGGLLPLHVFEERYRVLLRQRRDFGVVLIRRGWEVGPGMARELYEVGTVATAQRVEGLADGRYQVTVRGLDRFRLLEVMEAGQPYLVGRIRRLPDPPPQASPRLLHLLKRYLAAHGMEMMPQQEPELGRRAVWLVGSVLQAELPKRQRLLESGDAALAEELLSAELAKLSRLGRLGVVMPRPPSPN